MPNSKHRFFLIALWFLAVCLVTIGSLATTAQLVPSSPAPNGNLELPLPGHDAGENLNDLSLRSSSLHAQAPISGGVEEAPEYTREFYQMQWRAGDPIEVYVIRPKSVARPPVVLYLYGYPVDDGRFRNPLFCKLVTRGGVAAIGFMPALIGQRYHNVPMRKWFVSELHDSIVETVHDVQMVVSYTASRTDLDSSRVGIFGQGAGATIAGLAATVDSRIQAVDLLDPWGDWAEWMARSSLVPDRERADFLKPEYLAPLVPLDPVHWLPTLAGHSLKMDDALYETATPLAAKSRMEAALPASALLVHYRTKTDFDKDALADGKLIAWIQEQLLTDRRVEGSQISASGAASTDERNGQKPSSIFHEAP